MKTLFVNCKFIFSLWKYFATIFGKLLCFIKKRKLSTQEQLYQSNVPLSIQVHGDKVTEEIKLVDWNTWGNDKPPEEDEEEKEIPAEELFKDMEPVINKAKMVRVTKKIIAPQRPSTSPFDFQSIPSGRHHSSSIDFNPQYQVESELGTWEDEPSGWDNEIDETEINEQTQNMIKKNKMLEREKRAEEQKRKKLKKEQLRAQRRHESHIGVKIS